MVTDTSWEGVGNATFRQLSGFDGNKASAELGALLDNELLELKGKGRATYYITGNTLPAKLITPVGAPNTLVSTLNTPPQDTLTPTEGTSNDKHKNWQTKSEAWKEERKIRGDKKDDHSFLRMEGFK